MEKTAGRQLLQDSEGNGGIVIVPFGFIVAIIVLIVLCIIAKRRKQRQQELEAQYQAAGVQPYVDPSLRVGAVYAPHAVPGYNGNPQYAPNMTYPVNTAPPYQQYPTEFQYQPQIQYQYPYSQGVQQGVPQPMQSRGDQEAPKITTYEANITYDRQ
eukprot:TRINITY_DN8484_c0_g5_i4.p1 TRINITY_DN8484_c0_g5~~TRINITY_DN8484_c0_g5_i4.p1  ORF type:complete len:156 (+),score=8.40 TRINITY_DN8484_c0_g5_i4:87-554(+)